MQRDARNSPQHTPGPWFEDEAGICAADRLVAIIALPEEFFGGDPDSLPATVTAELAANAALIAAAPRLLAVAVKSHEPYAGLTEDEIAYLYPADEVELATSLRDAISRATGEVQS